MRQYWNRMFMVTLLRGRETSLGTSIDITTHLVAAGLVAEHDGGLDGPCWLLHDEDEPAARAVVLLYMDGAR